MIMQMNYYAFFITLISSILFYGFFIWRNWKKGLNPTAQTILVIFSIFEAIATFLMIDRLAGYHKV